MANGVVADNWSLQDVSALLHAGLEQDDAGEIVISEQGYSYKTVPSAAIQLEALFDLLTDIVLRDEIFVDEEFTYAWEEYESPINKVRDIGIIRSYPFLNESEKLIAPRDRIVEHICSSPAVAKAHFLNVEAWQNNTEPHDRLLSQTLWGGAGMCARSFVYEKNYTPHPLRKKLFQKSGFMLSAYDALHKVSTFVDEYRVKTSKKIYGSDSLYSMFLTLPALPLRVIQETSTPEQTISIALELRDEFQNLREWLKIFQNALAREETESIIKKQRELESVAKYVSNKVGLGTTEQPLTMEAGLGIFKLNLGKVDPINVIKNQFGVRATLNELILSPGGKNELSKFIAMFGAGGTGLAYEIQHYFASKS